MAEKFIQGAIQHPGSLRAFAKKHHAIGKGGKINLEKTERAAMRLKGDSKLHRERQINLARTLRRLRA